MRTLWVAGLSVFALAAGSASAQHQSATQVRAEQVKAEVKVSEPLKRVSAPSAPVKQAKTQAGPSKRVLAQHEAMKALAFLDGEWRGPSKLLRKEGWTPMVQTERAGTMLDGTVRMIESRGYETGGRQSFNTLAIISYDPDSKSYSMRSYSAGRWGDYPLDVTANGFAWEVPSNRQTIIRYEAVVKNGVWTQTATRVPEKGEPEKYVEFSAKRVRNGSWPAGGALSPK
ncbi:MAG: hypothetical protein Q8R02_24310 [Hyphomonadaceae bacterium]|nr:hypothetical protein [Hyphomonadaceae bacterium]